MKQASVPPNMARRPRRARSVWHIRRMQQLPCTIGGLPLDSQPIPVASLRPLAYRGPTTTSRNASECSRVTAGRIPRGSGSRPRNAREPTPPPPRPDENEPGRCSRPRPGQAGEALAHDVAPTPRPTGPIEPWSNANQCASPNSRTCSRTHVRSRRIAPPSIRASDAARIAPPTAAASDHQADSIAPPRRQRRRHHGAGVRSQKSSSNR